MALNSTYVVKHNFSYFKKGLDTFVWKKAL